MISASISGSLFAILLGLIVPNPFGGTIPSIPNYLFSFVAVTPFVLIYSFPVILTYGVFTSIISDKISKYISMKIKNKQSEIMISGVLHLGFGLILLLYSLGAAILFFIIDRNLEKGKKEYKLSQAIKSIAIPITVWLTCMGIIYLLHLLNVK